MAIVKRNDKGTPLTFNELDGNFTDLDGRVTTNTTNISTNSANITTLQGNRVTTSSFNAFTSSVVTTSSFNTFTSSVVTTSSFNAFTSSVVTTSSFNAFTSSVVTTSSFNAFTSSVVTTSSFNAFTASVITTGSSINSKQGITGSLSITGSNFSLLGLQTSSIILTNVLMISSSGQVYVTASSAFGGGGGGTGTVGPGAQNYLAFFSGSTTTISSSIMYYSASRFGIGTTTPSASIDLFSNGSNQRQIQFTNPYTTESGFKFYGDNGTDHRIALSGTALSFWTNDAPGALQNIIKLNNYIDTNPPTLTLQDSLLGNGLHSKWTINASASVNYDSLFAVRQYQSHTYNIASFSTNNTASFGVKPNGDGYFSGSVGIGTSNPNAKLDVSGSAKIGLGTSRIIASDQNQGILLGDNTINTVGTRVMISAGTGQPSELWMYYNQLYAGEIKSAALGRIHINPANECLFLIGGQEKARIDNNGNIGIGTTTPAYSLDVSSSIAYPFRSTSPYVNDSTSPNNAYKIGNLIDNPGYGFSGGQTDVTYDIFSVGKNTSSTSNGTSFFRINMNGGNSTGNYGASGGNNTLVHLNATVAATLRISAQGQGLDIIGSTNSQTITTISQGQDLVLRSDNNGSYSGGGIKYYASNNGPLNLGHKWFSNSVEMMRLDEYGNFTLAYTSPSHPTASYYKFAVTSSNSSLHPSGAVNLYNTLYITNTSNVGIGTSTPTNRLHVNGNVSITGSVTQSIAVGSAPSNTTIPAGWIPYHLNGANVFIPYYA